MFSIFKPYDMKLRVMKNRFYRIGLCINYRKIHFNIASIAALFICSYWAVNCLNQRRSTAVVTESVPLYYLPKEINLLISKSAQHGLSINGSSNPKPIKFSNERKRIWKNRIKKTKEFDKTTGLKRILFWTTFFDSKNFSFGIGHEPFINAGCQVNNCITTTDRRLLDESDALIFHPINYDPNDVPSHRLPHQRYIFLFYEAEPMWMDLPIFVQRAPGYFNWTMTYRRDSDIHSTEPYGLLRRLGNQTIHKSLPPALKPGELPPSPASLWQTRSAKISLLNKKTRGVAWFVSSCVTLSQREDFFQEVSRHISIDVYGKCGNLTCQPSNGPECDKILDDYKFYIAAENSLCADYVTEKFYRALEAGVVPIVFGGADYSAYAPPHSFIDALDFASPKDLAEYLRLLDNNPALYIKYFEWKKDWQVIRHPFDGWCDLCRKLNNDTEEVKSYENISKWWCHRCRFSHRFRPEIKVNPIGKQSDDRASYYQLSISFRMGVLRTPISSKHFQNSAFRSTNTSSIFARWQ